MKLVRDTIAAIGNKLRGLTRGKDNINPHPQRKIKPTAARAAQDARAFARQAEEISRYIWRNPGLSRHERRSLAAKIVRKGHLKRSGRMSTTMNDTEKKVARFRLKNAVKNFPAVCRRYINKAGQVVKRFVTNNPYYTGTDSVTK